MTDTSARRGWWQRHRVEHRTRQRTTGSRWLYRIDHYSSQSVVATSVGVLLVAALIVGIILGFRTGWVVAFECTASGITLTMVFVIQHTQAREQAATQRKLDELLRAMPEAQTGLMLLEEASEDVMREVEQGQRDHKRDNPH
jgi:low affinity Fe/Cu permease